MYGIFKSDRHRLKRKIFWSIEPQKSDSWIWKFLLSLRPLAKTLLSSCTGDGRNTSFWFDIWCPHGQLLEIMGENGPLRLGIPVQSSVHEALLSRDWQVPYRSRDQNVATVRSLLQNYASNHDLLVPDIFLWGPQDRKQQEFSTKITWEHLRPKEENKSWFPAVWFKNAVPKHSFNFWVANLDRLPVNARLAQWSPHLSPLCTFCSDHEESRDHMLITCVFATEIWNLLFRHLDIYPIQFQSWNDLILWLLEPISSGKSSLLRKLASQAAVYLIWRERNNRSHDAPATPPDILFKQLDRLIKDILLARRLKKGCLSLLSLWLSFG